MIDAVLVLVDSDMLAVIFKMLGVLRMLVDGQGRQLLDCCQLRLQLLLSFDFSFLTMFGSGLSGKYLF